MQVSLLILAVIGISNNGINAKTPSKIVGGYDIDITDAPFMVMIIRRVNSTYRTECAGSIISNRHILTAAHCLRDLRYLKEHSETLEVIAGKTLYRSFLKNYEVEKLYIHEDYIPHTPEFSRGADIAVITVKEKIPFNDNRRSIDLTEKESSSPVTGWTIGWGYIDTDTPPLRTLREIMVKIRNFRDCAWFEPYNSATKYELCVRDPSGLGGICERDSGTPLIVNNKLVGIASRGINCSLGYFIDIFYYKSWIEAAMNGTAKAIVYPASNASRGMPIHARDELKKLI